LISTYFFNIRSVEGLGADAVIAVNKEAGGHAGPTSFQELVPELVQNCKIFN